MLTLVSDQLSGQQLPDHLHCLFQHLQPFLGGWPAAAEDVLVERLACADAQGEPPAGQQRRSRGRLGDDGRMLAKQRAGDRCGDGQRGDL